VINGEMTDEQLFNRIACNLKGIDNFLFKKNKKYVTDEEINLLREGMEEAVNLKLHVENARRIDKIKNKIKIWVRQYGVKVVLADFLTLFRVPPEVGKYMGKTEEVDYILQVFTDLCKELKIPIILYVQMNREILGRHGVKEPNLGDLKQSGSIEELAFQVSFLHRPEYYDSSAKQDEMGEDISGLMYQIIAKHRDGKLDKIKLRANLAQSQVREWDSEPMLPFLDKNVEF
jgi:replicative DNA helicase